MHRPVGNVMCGVTCFQWPAEQSTRMDSQTAVDQALAETDSESDLAPGEYRVVQQASVTPSVDIRDVVCGELSKGVIVEIVEVRRVENDSRIRGRLADGGWISLRNTATGFAWALPQVLPCEPTVQVHALPAPLWSMPEAPPSARLNARASCPQIVRGQDAGAGAGLLGLMGDLSARASAWLTPRLPASLAHLGCPISNACLTPGQSQSWKEHVEPLPHGNAQLPGYVHVPPLMQEGAPLQENVPPSARIGESSIKDNVPPTARSGRLELTEIMPDSARNSRLDFEEKALASTRTSTTTTAPTTSSARHGRVEFEEILPPSNLFP